MARKADIRICRFAECAHTGKMIDISEDDYIADGRSYYHKECFEAKEQKIIDDRLAKEQESAARRLAKSKLKKCCYRNCDHENRFIDASCEEFQSRKGKYYHVDCFERFEKNIEKEKQINADIQLIKNMWIENISDTVVIPQLYIELNKLIADRGINSGYVLFVLDYCIKNKCSLRYPGGLKYYVDKREIKDAYEKEQAKKFVKDAVFKVDEVSEDNTPKFSVSKKPSGFNSILNRRR